MKKVLLSLLIIFSLSLTTTAQMFELYHEGNLVEMGDEMTVIGNPSNAEIVVEMSIKNISSATVSVKCRKMEVEIVTGSQNYFCWGLCFSSFIFLSPNNIDIPSGEISNEFSGHIMPAGTAGVTKMCYSFFDVENPNDSTYFYVNFNATLVGLEDLSQNEAFVSNPYPNPATSQVSFDYNLPFGTSSATVSVHNLLGAKVKEIELPGVEGKTTVNVNDLNDGIYFYSVSINNRIVETKRLVISR